MKRVYVLSKRLPVTFFCKVSIFANNGSCGKNVAINVIECSQCFKNCACNAFIWNNVEIKAEDGKYLLTGVPSRHSFPS